MKRFKHSILFKAGTLELENGQFTGLDTYEDFHLIPSSRPTIAMPGVETKFVTIPGRDGSLDLSEYLRGGRPAFGDRAGTFEFYVENDFDLQANPEEFWMTLYPKLLSELHGKKIKMVLREDDPDFYWEGRVTVDKYEPGDGNHSEVSISYSVGPFKRRIRKTSGGMAWDNFNFDKDYDYSPWNLTTTVVNGSWSRTIWGEGYPFSLEVLVSSGTLTVAFGGETKTLNAGQRADIGHASYGNNTISITGNGIALIDWRGGSL